MTTIKVRIALMIDSSGDWAAQGGAGYDTDDEMLSDIYDHMNQDLHTQVYFVTAEVPVPEKPEPVEIAGELEEPTP